MEFIENLVGLNVEKLETIQMIIRAIIVFFISLLFVRISGIRVFGRQAAFDQLTALMLGAVMGRVIVSADQPFFGTIIAAFVIMVLHRLVAYITFLSKKTGTLLKGSELVLIKDGKMQYDNMKRATITKEDITEALRQDLNTDTLDQIKTAYLERSGEISFIK
jgi:uncharacterized membrane protein YcaP (DUF421 family)